MEQTRKRSLTESEKTAERILIYLRILGLVPPQPYDLVIYGPIRRIAFKKDDHDYIDDIRERNVTFEWEYGLVVAIVLQQSCFYKLSNAGECSPLDYEMKFLWRTESIEIAIKKNIFTSEKQEEAKILGKIIFDNQMAVLMMEDAAKLHDSRLC